MISLSVKIRKTLGKKTKTLRKEGFLPAILYGPRIKPLPLKVDLKDFKKVYKTAGESSLISLKIGEKESKVLIHDVQYHSLTDEFLHVDFYQPLLKEKVTVTIPLVFVEEAPAVEELGGTLIKNISEVEVKGLPQELPKEIQVNIGSLKTFDDDILIKDLKTEKDIEILKELDEVVVSVVPPREEEIEEEIEEKIEEVKEVEEEKEEKEEEKEEKSP